MSELIEEGIEDLERRYWAIEGVTERRSPLTDLDARKTLGRMRAATWLDAVKLFPHTPPLSDEAISRESIYDTRG